MKKAFSLIELLLVLSIISMIMGTMKAHVQKRRLQADAKNIVECIKIYEAAITMYYMRNGGKFPENTDNQKLEDVDVLKPYCPAGFNTMDSINSKYITNINIYSQGGAYAIVITNLGSTNFGGEGVALLNEVERQLKEFSIESQVDYSEAMAVGINSGRRYYTKLNFYLKNGDNIYI